MTPVFLDIKSAEYLVSDIRRPLQSLVTEMCIPFGHLVGFMPQQFLKRIHIHLSGAGEPRCIDMPEPMQWPESVG